MEKAHASPDQDHHHILHSSMPIFKQRQEEEGDHHQLQEQEQEQEQLNNMSTEEKQEQDQDMNLENQPKKEQEDDVSSLHVPELTPHGNPSPSSDKTQPRNEEEAEGGRRKEEEPTKKSDNTAVTSSSGRSGRERLQRHRKEVAGHVWIPETWGQEELLKDWIDCSQFDACLVPTGVVSARAALVHQAATPNSSSSPLRIDNSPSTRPAGPPS